MTETELDTFIELINKLDENDLKKLLNLAEEN